MWSWGFWGSAVLLSCLWCFFSLDSVMKGAHPKEGVLSWTSIHPGCMNFRVVFVCSFPISWPTFFFSVQRLHRCAWWTLPAGKGMRGVPADAVCRVLGTGEGVGRYSLPPYIWDCAILLILIFFSYSTVRDGAGHCTSSASIKPVVWYTCILLLGRLARASCCSSSFIVISLLKLRIFTLVGDPCFCVHGVAPHKPLDSVALTRLKQFSPMNKLKKMPLRVSTGMCYHLVL